MTQTLVQGARVPSARCLLGAMCGVLVLVLGAAADLHAHEGHTHTVMGTVTARHDMQLEVKTSDGKTVSITLNDKTAVTKEKVKLTLKELAVGQRVVVNVGTGKTPLVAQGIKLGAAPGTGTIAVGSAAPSTKH